MKTITWKASTGQEIELRASYAEKVKNVVLDADGYKIETKEKEIVATALLELRIDGKKEDTCRSVDFWRLIPVKDDIKKIWGIGKIAMREERAKEVEAFLTGVIESGRDKEAQAIRVAEKESEMKERVETAKEIIKAAKVTPKNKDGSLMTARQATAWIRNYNNLHNEGGEGYIPYVVTQEEYEAAQKVLENIK